MTEAALRRRATRWWHENADLDTIAAMPPLQRARISAGLTQTDAAKLTGLSRRSVIRSEQPDTRCEAGTLAQLVLLYTHGPGALEDALREV